MYNNFLQDFFDEGLLIENIDDYVKYWHENDILETLRDFLGFTEYEYEVWLQEGNDVVRDILYCRRHGISLESYNRMTNGERLAARSYNLTEVNKYKKNEE